MFHSRSINGDRDLDLRRACPGPGGGETGLRARHSKRRRKKPGRGRRDLPPGAKSSSHRHARSAFIYAYVLSGAIRSQVDDQPAKVYGVGEDFYEAPGSHHRVSENASDREPAKLLAVFVVDSSERPLTIPDQK